MNKVAVGAAVVVVAAGGVTAFAAYSGGKVTSELQGQTAAMLSAFPGVKVVDNSVSKGLFSSTHTVTLELGCAPAAEPGSQPAADAAPRKPVQITWRDHVRHGPFPGGRAVGLAAIDTELVLPADAQAQVAKLFGDQPPVKAHTVLGFGGGYVTDISSPAFKLSEAGKGDLDWQGVRATLRGRLGGLSEGGSYTLEAPGFTMNMAAEGQAAGSVKVGRISFQGEVPAHTGGSIWAAPSKGSGSIASVAVAATPPGGKPVDVLFENLAFDSNVTLDNGLLSAVSKLGMKGRVDDFPIDKVEMQVSLHRLHAATYEQLIGRVVQSTFQCGKPGDAEGALQQAVAMQEGLQKDFAALLVHNPEYALDRLAIELGGKTAEISYRFGAKGMTAADAALPLPAVLTTKGYGEAAFKVQDGWLDQVVRKVVATKPSEGGASPEETAAATMMFIQSAIDDLVTKGYVARENGAVVSKAAFEGGMLKVNGQPMNVPLGMIAP